MQVSVVIPAYNEEQYIKSCLTRITEQVERPNEIIVVDNNCSDNTTSICAQFPDVKVIHEPNQGMIFARNKGFDSAKSEIIARCDADSIPPRDWIVKVKKQFSYHKIDALTGPLIYDSYLKHTFFSKTYSSLFKPILKGNVMLMGPNMSITKKIWNKVRKRVCLDDTKVHEDIDLTLHIIEYGGKIKFDKTLVIKTSGRRIQKNPTSFLGEYPIRVIRTLLAHKEYLSIPFLES